MGGDLGNLEDESEDFKVINEKDAPIKLPMDDGGLYIFKHKIGSLHNRT